MTKPAPRRQDAIQQKAASPSTEHEAGMPAEPEPSPAPLTWRWRIVFTLWAGAFGFMLAYELFRMLLTLLR